MKNDLDELVKRSEMESSFPYRRENPNHQHNDAWKKYNEFRDLQILWMNGYNQTPNFR